MVWVTRGVSYKWGRLLVGVGYEWGCEYELVEDFTFPHYLGLAQFLVGFL